MSATPGTLSTRTRSPGGGPNSVTPGLLPALSSRQPPTQSLAMTCQNMAINACVVTASPYQMATVRPVLLAWPPVMIPSGPGTMPPS